MSKEKLSPVQRWEKEFMNTALDILKARDGRRPVSIQAASMINDQGDAEMLMSAQGLIKGPDLASLVPSIVAYVAEILDKEYGIDPNHFIDLSAKESKRLLKANKKNNA